MATDSNDYYPPFWPFVRGHESIVGRSTERLDKALVAAWVALIATVLVDFFASRL